MQEGGSGTKGGIKMGSATKRELANKLASEWVKEFELHKTDVFEVLEIGLYKLKLKSEIDTLLKRVQMRKEQKKKVSQETVNELVVRYGKTELKKMFKGAPDLIKMINKSSNRKEWR